MKDKKKSKRQTLKRKYTIEKKCREHRKRLKKVLRLSDVKKGLKKKDTRIPNSWPFKLDMLEAIRREKLKEEQERLQRKQLNKQNNNPSLPLHERIGSCSVDSELYEKIACRAEAASAAYCASIQDTSAASKKTTFKQHSNSLKRILQEGDVIIQVLDARHPDESRHLETETQILSQGKKLVLLLNKIDLVPRNVTDQWLKYLRQFHPTIAFKAATTKSSRPLTLTTASREVISDGALQAKSQVVGASELMSLLKNYARTGSSTKSQMTLTVGVVGEPNVGKSSVINSLCRNVTTVKVGGEPGITKHIHEVVLDKKLRLLDTPGVIRNVEDNDVKTILRNAVKLTNVENPIEVVDYLIHHHASCEIMKWFKVPAFQTTSEFLSHLAKRLGKLKKGGFCDYESTARSVLYDWTCGKIPHYTLPPSDSIMAVDKETEAFTNFESLTPRLVSHRGDPMHI